MPVLKVYGVVLMLCAVRCFRIMRDPGARSQAALLPLEWYVWWKYDGEYGPYPERG